MYNPDATTGAVVALNEIIASPPGGEGPPVRKLKIIALKEGVASIIGMPQQGRPVMINITVKYDFAFTIAGVATNMRNPNQLLTVTNNNGNKPKYDYYGTPPYSTPTSSSDGVINVPYSVYPDGVYVEVMLSNKMNYFQH